MKTTWITAGLVLGAMALIAMPVDAAPVTFSKDVLPILQENCQTCHRPNGQNMSGMVAPMSFMNYKETRPWAKAIAKAVEAKDMPPWDASDLTHGQFSNERTLTKEQIATITDWVKQGAKRGNPSDAPEPIKFKEGWQMGEPDLVLEFPEPYFVEDEVQDLYYNTTVQITEEQLPEDKFVTKVEFIPGSEVVHHIIAYAADPKKARKLDTAEDLEAGGEEALRGRVMIGGLAPGTDPGFYPEGYGLPMRKGSEMTFAMHYHKESGPGTGVWDNSIMALKFADEDPEYTMHITNMAHGAFEIPPNQADWKVIGAHTFKEDIMMVNLFPHMHLRGKGSTYTAFYPDGTKEVLLETPEYDFNWQSYYSYKEPKLIPKGTRIEVELVFDNSPENAERAGFNPNRAVRFGGPTTDEMDLGWYTYAPAETESSD
jgi:hypothetical protein